MTDPHREQQITAALTHLQQGNAAACADICAQLVSANDQDAEAWSFLGVASMTTDKAAGIAALRKATELEPQEPRWCVHLGGCLLQNGDPAAAEPVLQRAAELSRGALDAILPWADCLVALDRPQQAVHLLRQAEAVQPIPAVLSRLANALYAAHDYHAAVETYERAFAGREIPVQEQHTLADLHIRLGHYERAEAMLEKIMPQATMRPEIAVTAAELARWQGKMDRAIDLLRDAMRANPDNTRLLTALLEHNVSDRGALLTRAETLATDESLDPDQRRSLAFIVTRQADKDGDYEKAWHYAILANSLYTDDLTPDIDGFRAELVRALRLYDTVAVSPDAGAPELIYVVGPPRSGGSLLQTVLAAHDGVASVGEWGALMPWVLPLLQGDEEHARTTWEAQKQDLHRADCAGLRNSDRMARTFVDKTPHQAHVTGLLQRLHPGAQFVDSRREARDIAVSILFHDFSSTFPYSRKMDDIADYLTFHREVITAWRDAGVPVIIHSHEEFIRDPDMHGANLFSALGLNWQNDFLAPEKRDSVVRTFSASQVRGEVTSAFSGRWQHYASFMGETTEKLAELNTPD